MYFERIHRGLLGKASYSILVADLNVVRSGYCVAILCTNLKLVWVILWESNCVTPYSNLGMTFHCDPLTLIVNVVTRLYL